LIRNDPAIAAARFFGEPPQMIHGHCDLALALSQGLPFSWVIAVAISSPRRCNSAAIANILIARCLAGDCARIERLLGVFQCAAYAVSFDRGNLCEWFAGSGIDDVTVWLDVTHLLLR